MESLIVGLIVAAALYFCIRSFVKTYKGEGECGCGTGCACSPSEKANCNQEKNIIR
ncbi:MAG: FeoB-associated Cys-rich membrane protein [Desulfobacterales bacterium]|nr:FeoB-associated Cys-rich membrane protein [Desulfobacterales bacterium]